MLFRPVAKDHPEPGGPGDADQGEEFKVIRQPSDGSMKADRPLAATAPTDIPAVIAALASPRRSSGNQSMQALVKQGISPAWAMPKISRDHQMPVNEAEAAVASVQSDQTRA